MSLRALFFLMSLNLLTFSCAPKDQKIGPSVRPNATPDAKPLAADLVAAKNISVLLDREVETLQLFKVLTDAEYAKKKYFDVEDLAGSKQNLKIISKELKFSDDKSNLNRQVRLQAQVDVDAQNLVQNITLQTPELFSEPLLESVTNLKDKTQKIISLKNNSKKIMIQKTAQMNEYSVVTESVDEVILSKTETVLTWTTSKMVFSVVENSYVIKSLQFKQSRAGANFQLQSDDQNTLAIIFNDTCSQVNGLMTFDKAEFKYTDSSLVLTTGPNHLDLKANECANRPVVDLSKLF